MFNKFCLGAFGLRKEPPLASDVVARFIAHLDLAGYSKSTIRSYLSALSYPHKLQGLPDPTASFAINRLMRSAGASSPRPPRLPITLDVLDQLCSALPSVRPRLEAVLFRSIFTMMFHLCARVGEVVVAGHDQHTLRCNQVTLQGSLQDFEAFEVQFNTYKHSSPGARAARLVLATEAPSCPVQALRSYLTFVKNTPEARGQLASDSHLFTCPNGQSVTSSQVSKCLSDTLSFCSLDPSRFGTHSFRSGGVTEAASKGASDSDLRLLGRWKSSAVLKYIKPTKFQFKY